MRNSWKGLVVGGLTGAVVGIALDTFAKAVEQATWGPKLAPERVPDAAEWIQEAVSWLEKASKKAVSWMQETDLKEHVREAEQRVVDSPAIRPGRTAEKVIEGVLSSRHPGRDRSETADDPKRQPKTDPQT